MKAIIVAVLIALLGVKDPASAAGPVPLALPAPPPPGTPTSSALRDAMIAIARAQTTNPVAAQNAAFSYQAAIQQYNAHQYERARASALTAISQAATPAYRSAPVPIARPAIGRGDIPGPRYYVIPEEVPVTAANASTFVTRAHRALATCASPKAAAAEYRDAVSALSAKQYRIAMATSRNIIDDCN